MKVEISIIAPTGGQCETIQPHATNCFNKNSKQWQNDTKICFSMVVSDIQKMEQLWRCDNDCKN